jgi:hypothetical protein
MASFLTGFTGFTGFLPEFCILSILFILSKTLFPIMSILNFYYMKCRTSLSDVPAGHLQVWVFCRQNFLTGCTGLTGCFLKIMAMPSTFLLKVSAFLSCQSCTSCRKENPIVSRLDRPYVADSIDSRSPQRA